MDKQKNFARKIRLWQWMVLLLLLLEIGLVFAINRQNEVLLKQDFIIQELANKVAVKNNKIRTLSARLISVMNQLKAAFEEVTQ